MADALGFFWLFVFI